MNAEPEVGVDAFSPELQYARKSRQSTTELGFAIFRLIVVRRGLLFFLEVQEPFAKTTIRAPLLRGHEKKDHSSIKPEQNGYNAQHRPHAGAFRQSWKNPTRENSNSHRQEQDGQNETEQMHDSAWEKIIKKPPGGGVTYLFLEFEIEGNGNPGTHGLVLLDRWSKFPIRDDLDDLLFEAQSSRLGLHDFPFLHIAFFVHIDLH